MNHWLDVGEILVDFDVVDNWHCELNKMNEGKKAVCLQISRFICSTSAEDTTTILNVGKP